MEIIEQIGAYAGLASVVGLAILAALYFSQARDVKRLREWAGRAPERGPVHGVVPQPPGRVVAQPQRQPPVRVPSPAAAVAQGRTQPGPPQPPVPGQAAGTMPPRPPGPPPAPVRAAASGAAPPAVPGPAAATPAAARVADEEREREEPQGASQDTTAHPPPPSPPGPAGRDADELEDEHADDDDLETHEPDDVQATDGEADDDLYDEEPDTDDEHEDEEAEDTGDVPAVAQAAPPPAPTPPSQVTPLPPPPPRPPVPSRPPPPMPLRTGAPPPRGPILPPYEQSRPGGGDDPWYRRGLASRGGILAVGASAFVVALVAVALFQLGGDEEPATNEERPSAAADAGSGSGGGGKRKRSAVVPRTVTVSVLNGTTVGGLARELGDKLAGQGFRLGNVTNSSDQQRAESVVLFAPGAEREAAEVGRRLKIDQREPIDPESQTLAGDAGVVVIAGADRAQ